LRIYGYLYASEDGTVCSEALAYKIQMPANYPEESIQQIKHLSCPSVLRSLQNKIFTFVKFWDSHIPDVQDSSLLGCYTEWQGYWFLAFRRNIQPSSLRIKEPMTQP